jgi:hypothetical protein
MTAITASLRELIFGTRKERVPDTIGLEMIEAENLVQLFCLAFVTERRLARLLLKLPRRRGGFLNNLSRGLTLDVGSVSKIGRGLDLDTLVGA